MDESFNNAPCGFVEFTVDGNIVIANNTLLKILGFDAEDLSGQHIHAILPIASRVFFQTYLLPQLNLQGQADEIYVSLLSKTKNEVPVLLNALRQERQGQTFFTCVFIPIYRRNEYEDQILRLKKTAEEAIHQKERTNIALEAALKEKEVLLKEVYHRVKNNLQVVSSLINLQAQKLTHPETLEVMKQSADRIKAMALLHEKLYQSKDLAKIDFNDYIQSLIEHLIFGHGIDQCRIKVIAFIENVFLDMDTAIPCGLIINELITNALKHAFPDNRYGEIQIRFTRLQEDFILEITDNGIGFPKGRHLTDNTSLGLQLVTTLTNQLLGNIKLEHAEGARFTLKFNIIT